MSQYFESKKDNQVKEKERSEELLRKMLENPKIEIEKALSELPNNRSGKRLAKKLLKNLLS